MRWLAPAAGLTLAVLAGLGLWLAFERRPEPPPARPALRADSAPAAQASARAGPPAGLPPPPRSLRGTRPLGVLSVDAAGRFVPGPEALLFFDWFLSASHEESLAQIEARIRHAIREQLAPEAVSEAEELLALYLAYRELGVREFDDPRIAEGADLERRLQWLRELRRAHFGPELAEALFAEEETATWVQAERRRVARDPELATEERARQLEALEERLPPSVREARARASLPLRHAREERALREAGASEAELQALRVEHFGPEAARRMGELDAARADWERRMGAYAAERELLAAEAEGPARAEALARLREQHFQGIELQQVERLDQLWAAGHLAPTR